MTANKQSLRKAVNEFCGQCIYDPVEASAAGRSRSRLALQKREDTGPHGDRPKKVKFSAFWPEKMTAGRVM